MEYLRAQRYSSAFTVSGAGYREPNPLIRRWEKNVLDIPSYRSGHYTQNAPAKGFECNGDTSPTEADAVLLALGELTWLENHFFGIGRAL
jgi:hypothetical protein